MQSPLLDEGNTEKMEDTSRMVTPFMEKDEKIPANIVLTSRYTLISYLPKCLFEQFRRLANVYFVVLGIIALVGTYTGYYQSAVQYDSLLAPVCIVVLISVIKEGVEDAKRHAADAKVNARPVNIVTDDAGGLTAVQWQDLLVGSIVLLRCDEEVPADIVVLSSGGVQGETAYVETAAIDGETNLKIKLPALVKETVNVSAANNTTTTNPMIKNQPPATTVMGGGCISDTDGGSSSSCYEKSITVSAQKDNVTNITPLNIRLNAEAPNNSIHHFDGSIEFTDSDGRSQHATLTEKNLLLRGSVLRATEWCVGMVVYTGKQTKLSLNSRSPPSKLSTVDRVVNQALVVAIGSMLSVCIISMIFSIAWQDMNINMNYLCLSKGDLNPPYQDGGGCTSSAPSSGLTIFTFATLYNNFVCISMYVSLEMIYLCQAYFIENDLNLYCPISDTPAECHTSGMCADIGQVQYILSDKTGTLTKNVMTLRRCSIAGSLYGAPLKPPAVLSDAEDVEEEDFNVEDHDFDPSDVRGDGGSGGSSSSEDVVAASMSGSGPALRLSRINSDQTGSQHSNSNSNLDQEEESSGSYKPSEALKPSEGVPSSVSSLSFSTQGNPSMYGSADSEAKIRVAQKLREKNEVINYFQLEEMAQHRLKHPISPEKQFVLQEYLYNLAVCNTVMLMPDPNTGVLDIFDQKSLTKSLSAESPDEVALVLAGAQYGKELLVRRDASETTVRGLGRMPSGKLTSMSSGTEVKFSILAVNEFDSVRKRMSVLVRKQEPNAPPVLYCKGADTSMMPMCVDTPESSTAVCLQHIDEFAVTGLRTLVMSRKILSEEDASKWLAQHKAASNNIGQRTEMLYQCALDIETDMELLGAVGIEDELQDGVSDAIQTLQRAGLNVWMITGDKPETAIAISQMCSLLRSEHSIHRVVGMKGEELRRRVSELKTLGDAEAARAEVTQRHLDVKKQRPVVKQVKHWFKKYIWYPLRSALYGPSSTVGVTSGGGGAAGSRGVSTSGPTSSTVPGVGLSRTFSSSGTARPGPGLTSMRSTIGGVECGAMALIVDGISLEGIWADEALKMEFTAAVASFPTVVACRVSPLQKASLVKMVKTGAGSPITLAIGDGANDVGMIHESRVGVGISGKEGRHAANSSDFAIGQFRFIVPLLLHHGRFNYIRCSKLVLYSFFKNLVLVSILFYYCFYSGFSGTVFIDSFILSGYNFYLGLPIIALGALDFDVSKADVMKYPKLAYNTGRKGELLNNWNMFKWCFSAFIFGIIIFTTTERIFTAAMSVHAAHTKYGFLTMTGVGFNNAYGEAGGIYAEGFLIFSVLVIAMQLKVYVMTNTMTYLNWIMWILSFVGFFLFAWFLGVFPDMDDNDWYHIVNFAMAQDQYWCAVFAIPILFVMCDLILDKSLSYLFPSSQDRLAEKLIDDQQQQQVPGTNGGALQGRSGQGYGNGTNNSGSNNAKQSSLAEQEQRE